MGDDTPGALGALRVDEGKLKNHVDEVVRSSVEETLNTLLDAEADQISARSACLSASVHKLPFWRLCQLGIDLLYILRLRVA